MLPCLICTAQSSITNYYWLLGKWEMKAGNKSIFEEWTSKDDSTLTGSSYRTDAKGKVTVLENMELRTRNGITSYVPTVNGQNKNQPVDFPIKENEDKKFVAENLQHDFPQRIIYELKNPAELFASIEGTKNGKSRIEKWIFKK